MNRATKSIGLLLVLAVAAIGLGTYKGDERAIQRQLKALIDRCEKPPGQAPLLSVANAGKIPSYFATNAIIRLGDPYPHQVSPRELSSLAAHAHNHLDSIRIELQGVDFTARRPTAEIEMIAAVELTLVVNGEKEEYWDEYRVVWRRIEGVWKIASAHAEQSIRRMRD